MKILLWGLLCAAIVSTLPPTCDSYKILGVFAYAGKSHFDTFAPLLLELANRGHELTVISHFPQKNPPPNYKDISLVGQSEILLGVVDANWLKSPPTFTDFISLTNLAQKGMHMCETLKSPQMQNFIKSKPKFDIIIHEHFNSDCYLILNHLFKAPAHIGLSSCTQMPWHYDRMGVPLNPSYVPISIQIYSEKMSFFERVHNTVGMLLHRYFLNEFMMKSPQNKFIKEMFGPNVPDLDDIAKNTSLFLLNSHHLLHRARPLTPNVIEVSGMHLPKTVQKLPADIEKFINESEHGVIYFSLGSMIKGTTFPEQDRKNFLTIFSKLKQRVLWKYENESLPGKPDNVMIKKWMPQYDILNHPNVIAFVSHGGLLGTIEGVTTGTPMVTIPFFGDQFVNAKSLTLGGTSYLLNYHDMTYEKIEKAVKFVLDPSTHGKAQRLAKIFNDRPMNGLETSVWWVEYIARNGDIEQMRPGVVRMPFHESMLLDVCAFLFSVLLVLGYIVYKLIVLIVNRFVGKTKKIKTN